MSPSISCSLPNEVRLDNRRHNENSERLIVIRAILITASIAMTVTTSRLILYNNYYSTLSLLALWFGLAHR